MVAMTTSKVIKDRSAPSTPPAALRTVIVTGGSTGIGGAGARALGHNAWRVALTFRRHPEQGATVAREIESSGGRALAVEADVSRRADVTALFDQAEDRFGPVDALVANAGVSQVAPLADSQDALVAALLGVNLLGTLYG